MIKFGITLLDHSLASPWFCEEKMKVSHPLSTAAVITWLFSVQIHTFLDDSSYIEVESGDSEAAMEHIRRLELILKWVVLVLLYLFKDCTFPWFDLQSFQLLSHWPN